MTQARRRISNALRSEGGFALPTVLAMIVLGMSLAGVMVMSSVTAQRGSARDDASKTSLAAADAGYNLAIESYRDVDTSQPLPCVVRNGSGQFVAGPPSADGWCPAITGTVDGATYTYRVKQQFATTGERTFKIVSSGANDEVSRRIFVQARHVPLELILGDFGVMGRDDLHLQGNSNIYSSVATNGDVRFTGGSGGICGEIVQHGEGRGIIGTNNPDNCTFDITYRDGRIELPPVDPGDIWIDNDNSVLPAAFNQTTRTLTSSATLPSGTFSFCKIDLQGQSVVNVAAGGKATLYFAPPSQCGYPAGTAQIQLRGGSSLSAGPGNSSEQLQIYFTGEELSKIDYGGNSASVNVMLYAPFADIELHGTPTYYGSFIGRTIYVHGTGDIHYDGSEFDLDLGGAASLVRDRYVECSASGNNGPTPDEAC